MERRKGEDAVGMGKIGSRRRMALGESFLAYMGGEVRMVVSRS